MPGTYNAELILDTAVPYLVTSARTSAVARFPAKTVWKNRTVSVRTMGASVVASAMILAIVQLRKALRGWGCRAIMGVILICV